jgi:hypothetical protein
MYANVRKKMGALLCLCLCFLFTLYVSSAAAAEPIDLDKTASLQLQYQTDQESLDNVCFQIYQVAAVSQNWKFTLTDDFAGYAVSLHKLDSDGWRDTAQTLAACAAADKLTPLQQAYTDNNGELNFTNLPVGLYLVVGEKHTQKGTNYLPAPFLICLPTLDEAQNQQYHVSVKPKYSVSCPSSGDDSSTSTTLEREVVKVWNDEGNAANRPEAITVQLLRDGEVYDTVTITAADNWRHRWDNLDADGIWQIVERDVSDAYTMRYTLEGNTFVLTNSAVEDMTEVEDIPASSDVPSGPSGSVSSDIPDNPEHILEPTTTPIGIFADPIIPDSPIPTEAASLPQTGQLWWPVPLLTMAGLALFLFGWLKQKRSR